VNGIAILPQLFRKETGRKSGRKLQVCESAPKWDPGSDLLKLLSNERKFA
jgi:hypothetical protein